MSNQDSMLKIVRGLAEQQVAKTAFPVEEVKVSINVNSSVLGSYVEELYANLDQAVSLKGGLLKFSEEELHDYIAMLIKTRVDYVNGQKVVFRPTDNVCVPSYISVVLSNIGVVDCVEFGLVLRPSCDDVSVGLDTMQKLSRSLQNLGPYGFEYAKGYERSKDGSFDFMAMSLVDDFIVAASKDPHPVYALLSATVGLKGIEASLSPRITYGHITHFERLVKHVAMLKG